MQSVKRLTTSLRFGTHFIQKIGSSTLTPFVPQIWEVVRASSLIGYHAIRTGPVTFPNGVTDHSFTSRCVFIKDVSPHGHIAIESEGYGSILNGNWDDGKWTRFPNDWCI